MILTDTDTEFLIRQLGIIIFFNLNIPACFLSQVSLQYKHKIVIYIQIQLVVSVVVLSCIFNLGIGTDIF